MLLQHSLHVTAAQCHSEDMLASNDVSEMVDSQECGELQGSWLLASLTLELAARYLPAAQLHQRPAQNFHWEPQRSQSGPRLMNTPVPKTKHIQDVTVIIMTVMITTCKLAFCLTRSLMILNPDNWLVHLNYLFQQILNTYRTYI